MRLLVTGGAGFIGSHFVDRMISQSESITVLDALTYAGNRKNLDQAAQHPQFNFVQANICDRSTVAEILKKERITGLIHFAAESHVDRSIEKASEFIQTNIVGTYTLLEASLHYWQELQGDEKKNFRYVQISTDEVFGSLGPTGKFSESSPYDPRSPYSASKAASDHLVHAWHHTYGLPAITTHCSNNYGPRQFPEKLIPHMIQCAISGRALPVYGDGKNVRDWIHVQDHCAGISLALMKGIPGSRYCFGGECEKANLDLVHTLCSILDRKKPRADHKSYSFQIQFVKDRLGHDRRYAIDNSLVAKELRFKCKNTFEAGLENTVEWYLNHSEVFG